MGSNSTLVLLIVFILILGLILKRLRWIRLSSYQSKLLGKIEVWQKYGGEKVLTTNSFPQGISSEQPSIKKSYWYKIALEAIRCTRKIKSPNILTLGLGANTSTSLLAQLNPKVQQTIVEIDAQIIKACREYFNLDSLPNSKIINADAFKYISNTNQKYDCIVVDIFLSSPPYIDLRSNQQQFIEKIIPILKKDGALIFNRPSHNQLSRDQGLELKQILKNYFKYVEVFDIHDPRGYRNYVVTAAKL